MVPSKWQKDLWYNQQLHSNHIYRLTRRSEIPAKPLFAAKRKNYISYDAEQAACYPSIHSLVEQSYNAADTAKYCYTERVKTSVVLTDKFS